MWEVKYSPEARKQLRKLDPAISQRIIRWIDKNLKGCENPYARGKALTGNKKGFWRYRVGDFRLLADIDHGTITIYLFTIKHRRESYR
ncbi:MAG: type II toxin-antitoxin system RelE/ParE family toxin [Coriobacteriia bacterium]|nr:type II toxin-antitoxin system RelE/ParE family toxin [Coriobacteriia bacterium]